jgi:hypothetical protein
MSPKGRAKSDFAYFFIEMGSKGAFTKKLPKRKEPMA